MLFFTEQLDTISLITAAVDILSVFKTANPRLKFNFTKFQYSVISMHLKHFDINFFTDNDK